MRLISRNVVCYYRACITVRREDDIECLLVCVAREFYLALGPNGDPDSLDFGYHIQPKPGYAVDEFGARTSEICWEAPVCLTVYELGKPLCGMAVELHGSVLSIRQLQGAPGGRIAGSLKSWPALFVMGAKNFLFNTPGVSTLRLYCADQRPSYQFPVYDLSKEEMSSYQQRLRRRYDGTARQQGFKKKRKAFWEWNLAMVLK